MLPQLDHQKPTPQSQPYFMLHTKGSKDGYSIFNYTNSPLQCLSPSPPPTPTLAGARCAGSALPLASHGSSESTALKGSGSLPPSCQLLAAISLEYEQESCMRASQLRIKGGWNSDHPRETGGKSWRSIESYPRWLDLQLQGKELEPSM